MSIFRPALVTALLVVLFSLLLFPIINTFINNKAISQLLAFMVIRGFSLFIYFALYLTYFFASTV